MPFTLKAVERRVLGVLLEKALAQPQYYPMTVNAVVAGCNQKSNRDPLLELDEQTVWDTLEVLRAGGLVARLLPGGASRVERYKHEVKERLGWEKPQRAVLAELLLRGPQTVAELRGRAARMYPFESTEAVQAVLDGLAQAEPPAVEVLARQPGQSTVRYAHKFYQPAEWTALARTVSLPAHDPVAVAPRTNELHEELAQLRGEVAALRAEVAQLKQKLGALGL